MKTNLRSMIDDALDGNMAREQHYGYHSPEPAYDASVSDVGVYKLAQALNYVSSNLNDLGTTDEKLAELALLQEKLATGDTPTPDPSGAAGGAGEAAADATKATGTFGDSWASLKNEGMGRAWDKLSTGRKWVAGAGAGLVGLGALYGGYKLLSGGGDNGNRTTVIKNASFSPLDEARSRAIINLADQYGLSQWDYMDKIAASAAITSLLEGASRPAPTGTKATRADGSVEVTFGKRNVTQVFKTEAEADAFIASRKAERGKALAKFVDPTKLDDANKVLYDKVVKGEALSPAERAGLEKHLAGNRTALKDATKTRVNTRTGQVVRTGRNTVVPLRNMAEIEIVDPADTSKKIKYRVDTSKKLPGGQPVTAGALQAEANRLHAASSSTANLFGGTASVAGSSDLAADTVAAARRQNSADSGRALARQAARRRAQGIATDTAVQQGYSDLIETTTGTRPAKLDGRQVLKRGRATGTTLTAEKLFGNAVHPDFKGQFDALAPADRVKVLQQMQNGTLDPAVLAEITSHSKLTPAEVQSLGAGALGNYRRTVMRAGTQNNPASTQYYARGSAQRPRGPARPAPGTAPAPRAVVPPKAPVPTTPAPGTTGTTGATGAAGEAAADSAGFFSRNRRALLTAGGIGAAGLAGYGLYRALNRGGNTYEPSPEPAPQASYGGGYDGGYKTASLRKLAEDRINPARIVAGKAAPFSGFDIHGQPCDPPVIENPVALRAQAVRAMINKSMNNYVSNTGDGYDLNRYLGHFNK